MVCGLYPDPEPQPTCEPVWTFKVTRHRGVFIFGVVVPWKRFNVAWHRWEWSAAIGYWWFTYAPTGYRERGRD